MDMKADVNTVNGVNEPKESVGEASAISWSLFASLEELRQAPMAPESVAPSQPQLDSAADHGAGPDNCESLQSVLGQYTEWLRTFNR